MPRQMVGTLTLRNSDSVHTPIVPMLPDKLYTITIPKHCDLFYLENYVHIVAFVPVLRRVSFHSGIIFLTELKFLQAYVDLEV